MAWKELPAGVLPALPAQDWILPAQILVEPMLAVLALLLVEEGVLDLDEPIALRLPEYANARVYVSFDEASSETATRAASRDIRVRDLLTHRSGLVHRTPSADEWSYRALAKVTKEHHELSARFPLRQEHEGLVEFARRFAALPLRADPGEERVMGPSFEVLAAYLELTTGTPLSELLRTRVLEPLGMLDTDFAVPLEKRSRWHPRMTWLGICADPIPLALLHGDYLPSATAPDSITVASDLWTTASDVLRFTELFAGRGERRSVRLVSSELFDTALEEGLLGAAPWHLEGSEGAARADGAVFDPGWQLGSEGSCFFVRFDDCFAGVVLWRIYMMGGCSQRLPGWIDAMLRGEVPEV